ncbi:MAG TPA: ribonuclease HI family protein [Bacteroidota bacterium]|nr:ribonuclease HI family protein [Bacteroidota bacterium]
MRIYAFTDGASRGNPGESGVGVVLKNERGERLASLYGYIGKTTNNIAEYTALQTCLKKAAMLDCTELIVHSDSELMVKQLNGAYKVKDAGIKKEFETVHHLLQAAAFQFTISHVPREQNKEADKLANLGIDTKTPLKL